MRALAPTGLVTKENSLDSETFCIYCELAKWFPDVTLQDIQDAMVNGDGEDLAARLLNFYHQVTSSSVKPAK